MREPGHARAGILRLLIVRLLIGATGLLYVPRGRLEAEVIVLRRKLNILRRLSPGYGASCGSNGFTPQ